MKSALADYPPDVVARALALHRTSPVADLHADSFIAARYVGRDLTRRLRAPRGWNPLRQHCDFVRLRAGGVRYQGFGIVVPPYVPRGARWRHAVRTLAVVRETFLRGARQAALVRTPAAGRAVVAGGRLAAFLGLEGCHALDGHPERLSALRAEGLGYAGLCHFRSNDVVVSGGDRRPAYRGLGPSGPAVIELCNALGIAVDLAHTGPSSFDAALERSRAPVFVSHGNARALCDHHRNLSDAQLRALADQGGVIGIMFFPWLISRGLRRLCDDHRRVVDHIDHVASLVGPEHVALGSDFDGMIWSVRGLPDVSHLPVLTCELVRRGYPDDAVRGILGGNWLRYWASVVAAAERTEQAAAPTPPEALL